MTTDTSLDTPARRVRCADAQASDIATLANAVDELYEDKLDVVALRGAMPIRSLAAAGARLDENEKEFGWARPNEKAPLEDIQLLGTDTPATPTYRSPRGASLAEYLDSASRHRSDADRALGKDFDANPQIRALLSKLAAGRDVQLAQAFDGRHYVPYTVRRLADGRQIGVHHDYHYKLDLYRELSQQVDTRTLISYVVTLRKPQSGGQLFVYGVTPTTPDAPKMPNGFQWDLAGIEARYDSACLDFEAGDLFLLASGRCLHRVGRVAGPQARITLGGFLALDKSGDRVLYWS